jgi:hypothetical protein
MRIHDYFASIERGIRENHKIGFLTQPVIAKAFDAHHGLLKATVHFWDGSQLSLEEVVSTASGYPEILRYSYTYHKDATHIFRYDNAPHHREIPTFPHHKHSGANEIPSASDKPSLARVFAEIEFYLTSES